jgi:N-methylhydantoinase B
VLGGKAPPTARAYVERTDGRTQTLGPLETLFLEPGDAIGVELPGGGGYGDPLDREAGAVLSDVLDGFVSIDAARSEYGVIIDPESMTVDDARTAVLRARERAPAATASKARNIAPREEDDG